MTSGLFRRDGHLIWVDIGRGSRAIVIALRDERLARLVIGVDDPEAMKRSLEQALDANPASVTVVA
jgi:methylase of polypeptide subunit release factors